MNPATDTVKKSQVTDALRHEVQKNEAFKLVCQMFAKRMRTRSQVTLNTLRLGLAEDGHHFNTKEYERILTFLANQGIGKLYFDARGKLKGLIEIKVTLQSVGKTALGEGQDLGRSKTPNRYTKLPAVKASVAKHQVYISAKINGKLVNFRTPMVMTSDEIVQLIAEMNFGTDEGKDKRGH